MTTRKSPADRTKKKRVASITKLEFLTPLSVRDCIDHLEAGRTPFKDWNITVQSEEDRFLVGLVEKNFRRTVLFGGRGQNYTSDPYSWAGPVWIEGTLREEESGLTRVTGQLEYDLGAFVLIPLIAGGILSIGLVLLVIGLASGDSRGGSMVLTFALVLAGLVYSFYYAEKTRARRFGLALSRWLEDRLDVERTK